MRYRFRAWDKEYKEYLPLTIQQVGVTFNFLDLYVIEQCTGLKDANGRYIYEGDILQEQDGDVGLVYWDEDDAAFSVCFHGGAVSFNETSASFYMVVGNENEDPEVYEHITHARV